MADEVKKTPTKRVERTVSWATVVSMLVAAILGAWAIRSEMARQEIKQSDLWRQNITLRLDVQEGLLVDVGQFKAAAAVEIREIQETQDHVIEALNVISPRLTRIETLLEQLLDGND